MAVHGVGPHTISVPRIKRADDIDPDVFDNGISDDIFAKSVHVSVWQFHIPEDYFYQMRARRYVKKLSALVYPRLVVVPRLP